MTLSMYLGNVWAKPLSFSKEPEQGVHQLYIDNKTGLLKARSIKDPVPREWNAKFNAVYSLFSKAVNQYIQNKWTISRQDHEILKHNVEEWNKKISTVNARIEKSPFLRALNKIIEFITCSLLSLKWKLINVDKMSVDGKASKGVQTPAVRTEPSPTPSGTITMAPKAASRPKQPVKKPKAVKPAIKWDENDTTPVGKWLAKHCNYYVGHAIHKVNVGDVLADGTLRSAGELLNTKGSVISEGWAGLSYSLREAPKDADIAAAIQGQRGRIMQLWEKVTKLEFRSNNCPVFFGTTKDHNELYAIAKDIAGEDKKFTFYEDMRFYLAKHDSTIAKIAAVNEKFIAHSKTIPDSEDRKEYLRMNRSAINEALGELGPSVWGRVCHSIRATKDCIAWGYGDVVVLKGNPSKDIMGGRIQSDVANEVQFLSPLQNKGKHFSLDLRQDDTIILGPKAVLEPYIGQFNNLRYFEDLTPEQAAFLKVNQRNPAALRKVVK